MKAIKTIGIIILLFGLPAGSWLFLKDGFNWRKAKMEELAPKGKFLDAYNFSILDKGKIYQQTIKKTTLVKLNKDLSQDDLSLIDQFKNSQTFLFLVLSDHEITPRDYDPKQTLKYIYATSVQAKNENIRNANYMLYDTGGVIRQFYEGLDHNTITKIVEDIAVVLPRKVTPDIETKKMRQNN